MLVSGCRFLRLRVTRDVMTTVNKNTNLAAMPFRPGGARTIIAVSTMLAEQVTIKYNIPSDWNIWKIGLVAPLLSLGQVRHRVMIKMAVSYANGSHARVAERAGGKS